MAVRIAVESWDPEYGAAAGEGGLDRSDVEIDASLEHPPAAWRPILPAEGVDPAREVRFVDGVRRIDAFVWLTDENGTTCPGVCASYAAGVARAAERATVLRAEARRGLFSSRPVELATSAGRWEPRAVAGDTTEALSRGVQEGLRAIEAEVARGAGGDDGTLVVLDGPLHGRQDVEGALGYIKSHHVTYLPEALQSVVHRLKPGERTPVFLTTTSWSRFSWYLRLPGPASHPMSGVVRLEASAEASVAKTVRLADRSARTLPRFASVPHKEARAPQNLFPISGLERELRRRLGDAALVQRALRRAAATEVR